MKHLNIIVTGAAGFIGSHLCEALVQRGDTVTGVDNFDSFYDRGIKEKNLERLRNAEGFRFVEGDAGDVAILDTIDERVDAVIHLAAKAGVLPSLKNPKGYIDANIQLTNNLLEWMRIRGISKFVFASSSSVYGNNAKIPFEETDGVNEPISPYAFTKRSCELMNYTYHSLYHFDIVNLRFFTVYGERQRPDLAIHKFVRLILNDQPITIYGDGSTARDYTYYADTVQGVIAALDYVQKNSGVFETFNLGNHSPVALTELIDTIASAAGKKPLLQYEEMKPGDVNITYASIDKAQELLGYHPRTSLPDGISRFIAWYKEQHSVSQPS